MYEFNVYWLILVVSILAVGVVWSWLKNMKFGAVEDDGAYNFAHQVLACLKKDTPRERGERAPSKKHSGTIAVLDVEFAELKNRERIFSLLERIISMNFRSGDLFVHHKGNRFFLLLVGASPENAKMTLLDARDDFKASARYTFPKDNIPILSFGTATVRSTDNIKAIRRMLDLATARMGADKKNQGK